jgi:hypothetical protein
MKRGWSIYNVLQAEFTTLELSGFWEEAIGVPEASGTWFIYGPPKNGKTSFALLLAKELSRCRRVVYNSIEEGMSLSMKMAMKRANMPATGCRMALVKQEYPELIEYLGRSKSPDIVFIDSIQFMDLKFGEYKKMKALFPHKLFVYISHIEGRVPEGLTARRIWRDANVVFRVEGLKAFPTSRYGGGQAVSISEEAAAYWGE